ncbi:Putative GEM-like protein 8 [Apostasia shenzhenica]|uniref:GEM-like protein 8 n=1 Tax=Apostasia shenzhenica TaxID=1088818 RepID=A0A2I0A943_9ASPA|nr:Putative GEM-like protein 8 [Apostasia shenzhenica]
MFMSYVFIDNAVNLGPKITETVKGMLRMGTRILQAGGIQRVFRKNFSFRNGEKLLKAFQCYLSTTAGPIAGLLFVSTKKIAFIGDSSVTIAAASDGEELQLPYKVLSGEWRGTQGERLLSKGPRRRAHDELLVCNMRHRERASDLSAVSEFCCPRPQKENAAALHEYAVVSSEYTAAGTNAAPQCPKRTIDLVQTSGTRIQPTIVHDDPG